MDAKSWQTSGKAGTDASRAILKIQSSPRPTHGASEFLTPQTTRYLWSTVDRVSCDKREEINCSHAKSLKWQKDTKRINSGWFSNVQGLKQNSNKLATRISRMIPWGRIFECYGSNQNFFDDFLRHIL